MILGDLAPDALPPESWRNLRDFVDKGRRTGAAGRAEIVRLGRARADGAGRPAARARPGGVPRGLLPDRDHGDGAALPGVRASVRAGEGLSAAADGERGGRDRADGGDAAERAGGRPGAPAGGRRALRQGADGGRADGHRVALAAGGVAMAGGPVALRPVLGATAGLPDSQGRAGPPEQFHRPVHGAFRLRAGREAGSACGRAERRRQAARQPAVACARRPTTRTFDYTLRPAVLQTRDGKSVSTGFARGGGTERHRHLPRDEPGHPRRHARRDAEVRFVVTRPATETDRQADQPRPAAKRSPWRAKGTTMPSASGRTIGRATCTSRSNTFSRLELADLWNRPLAAGNRSDVRARRRVDYP